MGLFLASMFVCPVAADSSPPASPEQVKALSDQIAGLQAQQQAAEKDLAEWEEIQAKAQALLQAAEAKLDRLNNPNAADNIQTGVEFLKGKAKGKSNVDAAVDAAGDDQYQRLIMLPSQIRNYRAMVKSAAEEVAKLRGPIADRAKQIAKLQGQLASLRNPPKADPTANPPTPPPTGAADSTTSSPPGRSLVMLGINCPKSVRVEETVSCTAIGVWEDTLRDGVLPRGENLTNSGQWSIGPVFKAPSQPGPVTVSLTVANLTDSTTVMVEPKYKLADDPNLSKPGSGPRDSPPDQVGKDVDLIPQHKDSAQGKSGQRQGDGYQGGGAGGLVGKFPIPSLTSPMLPPPRKPETDSQGLAPQGGTSGGRSGAGHGTGGSTPAPPAAGGTTAQTQPATGTASAKSPIACPALCQKYCLGGIGVEAFTVWRSGPKPADLPQKCTSHCSQHFSGVTATEGDTVGGINQCIRGFK